MDNFYNLSKYIGLKHIQKFRICRHWANEIYYLYQDKYDSIYDSDQRKRYNWIYLKKSLLQAKYIEDENIMYYVNYKLKTIIKVMNKTVIHRSYPFYITATDREVRNNYFIKSVGKYYRYIVHIIYVDTDDMYKVFNIVNHLSSARFIYKLKKSKPLKEYNRIAKEIGKAGFYGYDDDEILLNQHAKITQDVQIPEHIAHINRRPRLIPLYLINTYIGV